MAFFKSINSFIKNLDKQKLTYKDGFFKIPYMACSPEKTVKSFDKLYFSKHDKKQKKIDFNNLFTKGTFHYLELEEGLWIYVSNMQYKTNIHFCHYYHEKDTDPYYFLNFNQHLNTNKEKKMIVNDLFVSNQSWVLFKPLVVKHTRHFKQTEEFNVTINFNQTWLDKQLISNDSFINSSINTFILSEANFLSWPYSGKEEITYYDFNECMNNKEVGYEKKLKDLTYRTLDLFLEKYSSKKNIHNQFEFLNEDRQKIQIANEYILDHIYGKPITIDMICDKIGMSPTKFKSLFKLVYSNSVYQYYRDKKLEKAHLLIQTSEYTITEVANYIGYENTSKFATAYKQKFGNLPSTTKF